MPTPAYKSLPTCWECGESGHLRPSCPVLHPRNNYVALANVERNTKSGDPHNKVVKGRIGNKVVNILLDTGAALSLVDLKLVRDYQPVGKTNIVCVCNHSKKSSIFEVPIQIGTYVTQARVAGMEGLPYDVIFGSDQLRKIPQYQNWNIAFDFIGDTHEEVMMFTHTVSDGQTSYAEAVRQIRSKRKHPKPATSVAAAKEAFGPRKPEVAVPQPSAAKVAPKRRQRRKKNKNNLVQVKDRRVDAQYSTAPVPLPTPAQVPVVKAPSVVKQTGTTRKTWPEKGSRIPKSRSTDRKNPLLREMPAHGSFPPDLSKPPVVDPQLSCLIEDWEFSVVKNSNSGRGTIKTVLTDGDRWADDPCFTGYVDNIVCFTPAPAETLRQQKEDPSLLQV